MARFVGAAQDRNRGVYAYLLEREQAKVPHMDRIGPNGEQYRYPRHRLAALQADQPVTVPAWLLPRWAKFGTTEQVTVHPDDRIVMQS